MAIVHRGLLETHHVAEILGCSIRTVQRLIREKKLPAYRVGKRKYRIKREDAFRYLESCEVDVEKNYEE